MPLKEPFYRFVDGSRDSCRFEVLNVWRRDPNNKMVGIEGLTDEVREAGKSLIKREKRTGQELKLWGHLYEFGKEDYENYRFVLSNGDLRNKIVSIRQSRVEDQKRGVRKGRMPN